MPKGKPSNFVSMWIYRLLVIRTLASQLIIIIFHVIDLNSTPKYFYLTFLCEFNKFKMPTGQISIHCLCGFKATGYKDFGESTGGFYFNYLFIC